MLALYLLLVASIGVVACSHEEYETSEYLVKIEGIDGGDYFYPGESIENVHISVKKFVVLREYDESSSSWESKIKETSNVTTGTVDVDVSCNDVELFSKEVNLSDSSSELSAILIKDDIDDGDCVLSAKYTIEDEDSSDSSSDVKFRVDRDEGSLDNSCSGGKQVASYTVGNGHAICFDDNIKLNDKCQGVRLLTYYWGDNEVQYLDWGVPDTHDFGNHTVIIADSVPSDCRLTVDGKDYEIKMPSSLPNLTNKVTKVGFSGANKHLEISTSSETSLFVSIDGNFHHYDDNLKLIYPELPDQIHLMAFEADKNGGTKWSYLSGPRVTDTNGKVVLPRFNEFFTVASDYLVKGSDPSCRLASFNASSKSVVSFNDSNTTLTAGHQLFVYGSSCEKIHVGKFDVPIKSRSGYASTSINAHTYNHYTFTLPVEVRLPTKADFSSYIGVDEDDVPDEVFVYKRFLDDWELFGQNGFDWASTVWYNVTVPDNHACRTDSDSSCGHFLIRNIYAVSIVHVGDKYYWF